MLSGANGVHGSICVHHATRENNVCKGGGDAEFGSERLADPREGTGRDGDGECNMLPLRLGRRQRHAAA